MADKKLLKQPEPLHYLKYAKTTQQTDIKGGWVGHIRSGCGEWQQKYLNSETPPNLKTPCTLKPIPPAMCEKLLLPLDILI